MAEASTSDHEFRTFVLELEHRLFCMQADSVIGKILGPIATSHYEQLNKTFCSIKGHFAFEFFNCDECPLCDNPAKNTFTFQPPEEGLDEFLEGLTLKQAPNLNELGTSYYKLYALLLVHPWFVLLPFARLSTKVRSAVRFVLHNYIQPTISEIVEPQVCSFFGNVDAFTLKTHAVIYSLTTFGCFPPVTYNKLSSAQVSIPDPFLELSTCFNNDTFDIMKAIFEFYNENTDFPIAEIYDSITEQRRMLDRVTLKNYVSSDRTTIKRSLVFLYVKSGKSTERFLKQISIQRVREEGIKILQLQHKETGKVIGKKTGKPQLAETKSCVSLTNSEPSSPTTLSPNAPAFLAKTIVSNTPTAEKKPQDCVAALEASIVAMEMELKNMRTILAAMKAKYHPAPSVSGDKSAKGPSSKSAHGSSRVPRRRYNKEPVVL